MALIFFSAHKAFKNIRNFFFTLLPAHYSCECFLCGYRKRNNTWKKRGKSSYSTTSSSFWPTLFQINTRCESLETMTAIHKSYLWKLFTMKAIHSWKHSVHQNLWNLKNCEIYCWFGPKRSAMDWDSSWIVWIVNCSAKNTKKKQIKERWSRCNLPCVKARP